MALIPKSVQDLDGKVVLVIWGADSSPSNLQQFAEDIKSKSCSNVLIENVDRLLLC